MKISIRRSSLLLFVVLSMAGLPGWSEEGPRSEGWPQWGQNPQHTGTENVSGQHLKKQPASGRPASAEVLFRASGG
jgi:hypothetical protein